MKNFTYEKEDRVVRLETYEWDDIWWEETNDIVKPRVLYIGDSISCGIRRAATKLSGKKILFDGFETSKAVDNDFFADALHLFGKQQKRRNVVIFNNGLHGFHLNDTTEYGAYYEKMVNNLMKEYQDVPIALVLTTSIEGPRNSRVIERNETAIKIALKYSLPFIDLYTTSVKYVSMRSQDGVHFSEEGYEKLADQVLESLYRIVPNI